MNMIIPRVLFLLFDMTDHVGGQDDFDEPTGEFFLFARVRNLELSGHVVAEAETLRGL